MFTQAAWKFLFILRDLLVGNKFRAGLASTFICERHAVLQLGYVQTMVHFHALPRPIMNYIQRESS